MMSLKTVSFSVPASHVNGLLFTFSAQAIDTLSIPACRVAHMTQ